MALKRDTTIRTVEIDTKIPNCFVAQVILPIKIENNLASYIDAKKYEEDCKSFKKVSIKMLYSDSVFHNVPICDQVLGKITYPSTSKPRTTFVVCMRKFPDNLPIIVSTFNNESTQDSSYTELTYKNNSTTSSFDPTSSTIVLQAKSDTDKTLISLESVSEKAKIRLYSKENIEISSKALTSIESDKVAIMSVNEETGNPNSIVYLEKDAVSISSGSIVFNITNDGLYANKIDDMLGASENNNDDGTDYVVLSKNLISILSDFLDAYGSASASGSPLNDKNGTAAATAGMLKAKLDTIKSKIFKTA
jgi:hypothetical protein